MWQSLFSKVFGSLKFEGAKALLHQLERFSEPYALRYLSADVGTLLVEGVDAVVHAGVNALDKEKGGQFAHGYVAEIEHDLLDITQALYQYVPLQVELETALKEFGSGSEEVKAAIEARNAAVLTIKTDMTNLFTRMVQT